MKRWKILSITILLIILASCAKTPAVQPGSDPEVPSAEVPETLSWNDLTWDEHLPLAYAESFTADYSPEGYARIIIDNITYILIPEGAEVPADIPSDVTVLRQPLQNIYLQATAAMDCFRKLDAISAVTLSGTQSDGWYIPEAREAMEAGDMIYAGKYNAPDYELIQSKNCDLALESTMIYHNPEVKEQLERLGIPVLVERSSYEVHPLGRMEWIKLYGVLLDREEDAEAYFNAQLEKLEPVLEQENTGKTAAFFSITSNGSVTVRKAGDYIAKAIDLAGGVYVPQGLAEEENALSTMNIQMETFYNEAKDADVLIYNSTIEANLETIEQLIAKSAPLADFKAVQNGNVWCTGKSMFQESQSAGEIILDIHNVLTGESDDLTYLHQLT